MFCTFFAAIVCCAVDMPWTNTQGAYFPYTTFAFLVGAATSMLCGYIGMVIATICNYKTTYLCNTDKFAGFKCAFQGGQVLGFCLVGIALLVLEIIILCYKAAMNPTEFEQAAHLFEFVSGYGLGGSTVALFGRVGGGIYTKAADVGADLAGKVDASLPEDSPKNPGTIADNVGDNVGDIAGMGADLFGSLAESTCAALIVSSGSRNMVNTPEAIYFPLVVTAIGIVASFICQWFAYIKTDKVELQLKIQLWVSTILMSAMIIPAIYMLPEDLGITFAGKEYHTTRWEAYTCIILGLWSGLFIGLITEYYTSKENRPTQELAEACKHGAAPNIINGLALGYLSTVVPIFCLAITVLVSFYFAAMYGVALAAIGMLGCLPIALSIDGYGPISDNAGGIAEMSNVHKETRENTDDLDAAGNTTAAIGKGFAIGSAALVALALIAAFVTRCNVLDGGVNLLNPAVFAFLLIGSMLPYWFSAMTMKSVGIAAMEMVKEVKRQFDTIPGLLEGTPGHAPPDHARCIKISTDASLREMVPPAMLVISAPIITGTLFGVEAVTGLLAGGLVSGVQLAISASNTGGAWDNAKKYIEKGGLYIDVPKRERSHADPPEGPFTGAIVRNVDGSPQMISVRQRKGSECHKAAVVGDTVGDPLKDTSGPAVNILMKLSAIISLVFCDFFMSINQGHGLFNLQ